MTSGRRCANPTDATAVMVAHRLMSSVMRSNNDCDWPVHSLMLSFDDFRGLSLRRPLSTVHVWFSAAVMSADMAEP